MALQIVGTADEAGEQVVYIEVSRLPFAWLLLHTILALIVRRVLQVIIACTLLVASLPYPHGADKSSTKLVSLFSRPVLLPCGSIMVHLNGECHLLVCHDL